MTDNRALARHLFDVGVAAADPYRAVARVLADVQTPSLIIAVGKAATRMDKQRWRPFRCHASL